MIEDENFDIDEPIPDPETILAVKRALHRAHRLAQTGEILSCTIVMEQSDGDYLGIMTKPENPFGLAGYMNTLAATLGQTALHVVGPDDDDSEHGGTEDDPYEDDSEG